MKGIKKTLFAGFLACSALNAQAEMSPFGYGIKVDGTVSSFRVNDEAKFSGKPAETKILANPFIGVTLYGEYAFTDYLGVGLGAGYMNQGGSVNGEEVDAKDKDGKDIKSTPAITMTTHGVIVPLNAHFYPLGREEDEGILKVFLGVSAYIPLGNPVLKTTGRNGQDNEVKKEDLPEAQQGELPGLDFGGQLGVGYEFPFGLSIEGRYGMNFINRFTTATDKNQTIFTNVTDLKSAKTNYITLGVGYNFAALFTE